MAFKLLLLVGADIPKREKNFSGRLLKSIFDTGHIIWTLYKPEGQTKGGLVCRTSLIREYKRL